MENMTLKAHNHKHIVVDCINTIYWLTIENYMSTRL